MRPSELLALTVEDVDLAQLTVHVSKRIRRVPERSRADVEVRFEIDEPKTENSIHEVLLSEELVPVLRPHLAAMGGKNGKSARAKSRQRWVGRYGHLLFTTQSGVPVDWANMRVSYRRICRRANLGITVLPAKGKDAGQCTSFKPLLKPYALRHTHATLSLADGADRGHQRAARTTRRRSPSTPTSGSRPDGRSSRRLRGVSGRSGSTPPREGETYP